MKRTKYVKRVISIVMILFLVVFGKFAMKAMVTRLDSVSRENGIATEEIELESGNVETETGTDNGEEIGEKEDSGVQYKYDKLNRLTEVIYADGSTVSYQYDKNGNIVDSVVDVVATSTPQTTIEPTVAATIRPTTEPTQEPVYEVTVYYANSSWSKAYVHYKIGEKWTTVPGKEMEPTTEISGYTWKYTIELGSAEDVSLMFTDGEGTWDKNSDGNKYVLSAGVYGIKNYTISPDVTVKPTAGVSPSPSVTEEPKNVTTVYYANSSWSKAYVHYKIGEKWTTVPGKEMEPTTEINGYTWKYTIELGSAEDVSLMFTDGEGTWDKNSDGNKYVLSAGVYGIKNYTISPDVTVKPTAGVSPSPSVTEEPKNVTTVYYANSSWSKAYVHYKIGEKWTTVPGKEMEPTTEISGYTWKYTIELGSAEDVTFMFTDGEGTWDKNSDDNKYILSAGVYGIKNYTITTLSSGGTPIPANTTTVYYANSSWTKAYVHYMLNGVWTTVPGKEMEETTEVSGYTWKYTIDLGSTDSVTLMFTDGNGTWDKNSDGNKYILNAGRYGIKSYHIISLSSAEPTAKVTTDPILTDTPSGNMVTVYYKKSSFSQAYIHYKVGSESWTTLPGVKMGASDLDGYTWMYTIDLGTATDATVCFNNGSGTWDSNSGSNYKVYTGRYGIASGTVYDLN